MSLSVRLALRYLFKQRLGSFSSYASWLAVGGLSIGIAALMLTASIIEGFENTLSEKTTSAFFAAFFGALFYVRNLLSHGSGVTARKA